MDTALGPHAIENRDVGAGVDRAGDPLVSGAVLARHRQCARGIAAINHFDRIRIAGADERMRPGTAWQGRSGGACRKRQKNGGDRSGHRSGQFVRAATVPIFVAPVDYPATARRRPRALSLTSRAAGRWRRGEARQRHALIDGEADRGDRCKKDRDHRGPGDAAGITPIVRRHAIEGCTRAHHDLLGCRCLPGNTLRPPPASSSRANGRHSACEWLPRMASGGMAAGNADGRPRLFRPPLSPCGALP